MYFACTFVRLEAEQQVVLRKTGVAKIALGSVVVPSVTRSATSWPTADDILNPYQENLVARNGPSTGGEPMIGLWSGSRRRRRRTIS